MRVLMSDLARQRRWQLLRVACALPAMATSQGT